VGEIAVRGDNVMLGYWNRPEETAKAVVDGWMHTGDGGYMDEDGFVYVVDRIKDMIITGGRERLLHRGGERGGPASCRPAMCGHRRSRPAMGRSGTCGCRRQGGDHARPLIDFCKERIGGYKCPRSVEVRTDPLPISGAGKILKRELRRPFWEGQSRRVA
jgi:long-chain acyl-CoA synthetase